MMSQRQRATGPCRALFLLLPFLLVSLGHGQCTRAGEAKADAAPLPMKRLRGEAASAGALSPDDADKPAGCAMPLTLAVSEGQRKKELALGISVRTGVGDSEEFETDTLTFMPGSQLNVTMPIVPCGETLIGILMRVLGNKTSETLLLDNVSSSYMGGFMRSSSLCENPGFVINQYKSLIDLDPGL